MQSGAPAGILGGTGVVPSHNMQAAELTQEQGHSVDPIDSSGASTETLASNGGNEQTVNDKRAKAQFEVRCWCRSSLCKPCGSSAGVLSPSIPTLTSSSRVRNSAAWSEIVQ
ncbi:hypothetical protein JCM8547_005354 [Rhodosporidiobolus lusitaniae]